MSVVSTREVDELTVPYFSFSIAEMMVRRRGQIGRLVPMLDLPGRANGGELAILTARVKSGYCNLFQSSPRKAENASRVSRKGIRGAPHAPVAGTYRRDRIKTVDLHQSWLHGLAYGMGRDG